MPAGTEPPPGVWPRAVATAVADLAAQADISQYELSRRSGVGSSTLYRCLRGQRSLTLEELARVSMALGLTPTTIILRAQRALGGAESLAELIREPD